MTSRSLQRLTGSCHHKRVTPDFVGVNVFCLDGFDPAGIPVRATRGAEMA